MYSDDFLEFKPEDYLKWAKYLYKNLNSFNNDLIPAIKRDIASRAYYASFLKVKKYVSNNYENYIPIKSEHKYLQDFILKNNIFGEYNSILISDALFILKMNRVQCDYHFTKPYYDVRKKWSSKTLYNLLEYSDCIFNTLKKYEED